MWRAAATIHYVALVLPRAAVCIEGRNEVSVDSELDSAPER